jgi:hypothetical protein
VPFALIGLTAPILWQHLLGEALRSDAMQGPKIFQGTPIGECQAGECVPLDGGKTRMETRQRWNVRWWIRLVGIAAVLILVSQQFSTIYFVSRGEMPASEIPLGWTTIGALALLVVLMTFRPYIELHADGQLVLQGPIRKHAFQREQVKEVHPTEWGLRFTLTDGSHRTSIVCQDTWSRNEPRWFDVAQAVTGRRPVLEDRDDWSDDEDD